jgi:hypothetical protein
MWQKSAGNEYVAIELLPRLFTQDKEAKMKQNEQHENYGLYITQNTYQMKFYCFSRDVADAYWNGEPCKKASGKTSQEALSNYKNGNFQTNTP